MSRFRIETGLPFTPFDENGIQDPTLYNSERIPVNHSLDIRLDRRWFFGGWSLIVYLDVQNIYNFQTHQIPRYNARKGELEEELPDWTITIGPREAGHLPAFLKEWKPAK